MDEWKCCLCGAMQDMAEWVPQQTHGFPKGKEIKEGERPLSRTQCFCAQALTKFPHHPFSFRVAIFFHEARQHNTHDVTHFFARTIIAWEWETQLESIFWAQGEAQVNASTESLRIKCTARWRLPQELPA